MMAYSSTIGVPHIGEILLHEIQLVLETFTSLPPSCNADPRSNAESRVWHALPV